MPEFGFIIFKDPLAKRNPLYNPKPKTLRAQFLCFLAYYPLSLNDLIPDHKFSIDIDPEYDPHFSRVVIRSEQEVVVNKLDDFILSSEYDTEWCRYIISEMIAAIPPESGIFKYFYLNL